jgi:membrane protease YdiL (CAAX protease family)
MGVPLAVTLNVILYSLLHWRKSVREAIGAIPFGVVLCLIMLQTGSLLAPVLVHLGLSGSTEVFSFIRNPGMKLVRNER